MSFNAGHSQTPRKKEMKTTQNLIMREKKLVRSIIHTYSAPLPGIHGKVIKNVCRGAEQASKATETQLENAAQQPGTSHDNKANKAIVIAVS